MNHFRCRRTGALPAEVVADFEEWVRDGCARPSRRRQRPRHPRSISRKAASSGRSNRPGTAKPPSVKNAAWPKSDIDRFLLAALEAKGLSRSPMPIGPRLIRRVSFDLIGLPPAPEEVEAFIADTSADAFKKVVERLLASPRFGERWGRHWLDVARFAESSGKANMMYPNAWRYRDWVIAAFNDDKPFDAFVREQLAGDLLPAGDDRQRAELAIATGFLALGQQDAQHAEPPAIRASTWPTSRST